MVIGEFGTNVMWRPCRDLANGTRWFDQKPLLPNNRMESMMQDMRRWRLSRVQTVMQLRAALAAVLLLRSCFNIIMIIIIIIVVVHAIAGKESFPFLGPYSVIVLEWWVVADCISKDDRLNAILIPTVP
jgi:hypothetical protein